jgi:3'-5' exoribonuclease
MSRSYVNILANGDSIDEIYLVADKQLRANKQGNLYLQLELRDKTGAVGARLWNASENLARVFEPGDHLRVKGKVQLFQGALQVILSHIEPVSGDTVEPSDFLPQSARDVGKLIAKLREILFGLSNPHLRALAECFLIDDEFVRKFTVAPAGVKNHHAYGSGLLEHVVTMLTVADRISDLYPEVDRELLLAGIFLHDIGKIDELSYDRSYGYTDEGQLVGHLVMGVAMLREKIKRAVTLTDEPFPEELRLRLEHMIVSHHGALEFGSAKVPMTPEAVALHHLDNFDAKVHLVTREIRDDPTREASWTPFNPSLGRRLFKGYSHGAGGNSDGAGES